MHPEIHCFKVGSFVEYARNRSNACLRRPDAVNPVISDQARFVAKICRFVEVDMKYYRVRRQFRVLSFLCLSLVFSSLVSAQDKDWRPVSAQELGTKTPVVEPDADAEAIFWEVRIDDSSDEDLSLKHYVRVKIFTERGREKYSKFDIPFTKGMKIKDLAARVTKPDGTSVEIKKEDVFEREIIKASGLKIKAKSFAVPNIEPGVIIEYRYKESINDAGAMGMRLQFQRDVPVQNLSYFYKPYNSQKPRYQSYNFSDTKFVKDKDGFYLASRMNVPALKEEPRMPPDDMVRPWMLLTGSRLSIMSASAFSISFAVKDPSSPALYWGAVSTERAALTKFMTKSNGDIKKAAAEITAGAATPDEKLRKLYEFCQTQIKNTSFDPALTDEQRQKLPETKSLNDVLKRKSANSQFVDLLYGALTNALGFETRIAYTGNRSEMFFDPNMANESLIHPAAIAVKVGDDWKFFNPGMAVLPYGMLVWYEEDVWAILVGNNNYVWVKTPLTGHDGSVAKRKGKFTLLEDGTLEGDVVVEYVGQMSLTFKMDNFSESQNKLEEDLKDGIKRRISTAEISDLSIENVHDPVKPIVYRYKVRVPNYAQKTGKRLFLQPGFFEYGSDPLFSGAARKYDVYFDYPWSEVDSIEINLPKNFDLDNADAPGEIADPQKIGSLKITIGVDKVNSFLKYDRKFHFGGGGNLLFPAASYQPVKNLFDTFHKSDSHTITLRQK